MRFVSCHNGQIFTTTRQWDSPDSTGPTSRGFRTGLAAIDQLLPHGLFARGAVHEILTEPRHGTPRFFPLLLARAAAGADRMMGRWGDGQRDLVHLTSPHHSICPSPHLPVCSPIVWCDPRRTLYPPAVAASGVPPEKLFLLYPSNAAEQLWAITECLRCKGVAATIAPVSRLSRTEARRLQLAAERGGGVGILLRPLDRNASIYAAATRWLVCPCQGLRTVQRWKIQLIYAHGGRVGQTVILEHHREEHLVRAVDQLADRPAAKTDRPIRASA